MDERIEIIERSKRKLQNIGLEKRGEFDGLIERQFLSLINTFTKSWQSSGIDFSPSKRAKVDKIRTATLQNFHSLKPTDVIHTPSRSFQPSNNFITPSAKNVFSMPMSSRRGNALDTAVKETPVRHSARLQEKIATITSDNDFKAPLPRPSSSQSTRSSTASMSDLSFSTSDRESIGHSRRRGGAVDNQGGTRRSARLRNKEESSASSSAISSASSSISPDDEIAKEIQQQREATKRKEEAELLRQKLEEQKRIEDEQRRIKDQIEAERIKQGTDSDSNQTNSLEEQELIARRKQEELERQRRLKEEEERMKREAEQQRLLELQRIEEERKRRQEEDERRKLELERLRREREEAEQKRIADEKRKQLELLAYKRAQEEQQRILEEQRQRELAASQAEEDMSDIDLSEDDIEPSQVAGPVADSSLYKELVAKLKEKHMYHESQSESESAPTESEYNSSSAASSGSYKIYDVRRDRPKPIGRLPSRKHIGHVVAKATPVVPEQPKENDYHSQSESDSAVDSAVESSPNQSSVILTGSKRKIVEEIFNEATPQKLTTALVNSEYSSSSSASEMSSPRSSIMSISSVRSEISDLDVGLKAEEKRQKTTGAKVNSKIPLPISETDKKLKRAEENRLKLQQQALQSVGEKQKKKELANKRALELAEERKRKERDELKRKNEEKRRKKEELESSQNDDKKKKIEDKINKFKENVKEKKKQTTTVDESKAAFAAKLAEQEARIAAENAPTASVSKITTATVAPPNTTVSTSSSVGSSGSTVSSSVTTQIISNTEEEKPKSTFGSLVNFFSSIMSGTAQPPTQTTTTTTAPVSQIPKPKVYTSATDSAKSVTDSLLSVKNTLQSNKENGMGIKSSNAEISPWIASVLANSQSGDQKVPTAALQTSVNYSSNVPGKPLSERELMPPPSFSPKAKALAAAAQQQQQQSVPLKLTPPKPHSKNSPDKIIDILKQFYSSVSGQMTVNGLNTVTKENVDKLRSIMNIEDFFKFKKNLARCGWDNNSFTSEASKELLQKLITDLATELNKSAKAAALSTASSSATTVKSDGNYHMIADYASSDDEDESYDSDEEEIPEWAKGPSLENHLRSQEFVDPEKIFPEVYSCNLEDIFKDLEQEKIRKNKRIRGRTSSANWTHDGVTLQEKQSYRQQMGFWKL